MSGKHAQRISFAAIATLTALVACGSKNGAKSPANGTARDGGADAAGPAIFATSPPPSGLPPMAVMPPPGVAGSKKAKIKSDGALAACGGQVPPHGKDPGALVKTIGDGCAAASKMKPVGPGFRGSQADKDAHQENKFHADSGHCYRVYFATDDAVKDVAVVLRDSSGDIIDESAGPSAPQAGAVCFTAPDDVTVMLAVGNGKGAWAAQVWGD